MRAPSFASFKLCELVFLQISHPIQSRRSISPTNLSLNPKCCKQDIQQLFCEDLFLFLHFSRDLRAFQKLFGIGRAFRSQNKIFTKSRRNSAIAGRKGPSNKLFQLKKSLLIISRPRPTKGHFWG